MLLYHGKTGENGIKMPKSSQTRLMEDEKKILEILEINAHESIDDVAKKCGFSRQKVWRIIKKLEAEKTIWGYTAICEQERYNLKHFIMMMKRNTNPIDQKVMQIILTTRLDNLIPDLKIKMEDIEYTHGSYDGIFTFYAPDLITAKKFCDRFKEHFNQYVADVELLEGIFFIRNQRITNPNIKKLVQYL
jgi:DNA-binding Lrp family transcriptional regulator